MIEDLPTKCKILGPIPSAKTSIKPHKINQSINNKIKSQHMCGTHSSCDYTGPAQIKPINTPAWMGKDTQTLTPN